MDAYERFLKNKLTKVKRRYKRIPDPENAAQKRRARIGVDEDSSPTGGDALNIFDSLTALKKKRGMGKQIKASHNPYDLTMTINLVRLADSNGPHFFILLNGDRTRKLLCYSKTDYAANLPELARMLEYNRNSHAALSEFDEEVLFKAVHLDSLMENADRETKKYLKAVCREIALRNEDDASLEMLVDLELDDIRDVCSSTMELFF